MANAGKPAKKETKEIPAEKVAEKPKVEEPVAEKIPVKETPKPKVVEEPVAEEKQVVKEQPPVEEKKKEEKAPEVIAPVVEKVVTPNEVIMPKMEKLQGLTIMGKIVLPVEPERRKPQPIASSDGTAEEKKKRKRKTTFTPGGDNTQQGGQFNRGPGGGNNTNTNNRPGGPNNNRPGGPNNNRQADQTITAVRSVPLRVAASHIFLKRKLQTSRSRIRLNLPWPSLPVINREEAITARNSVVKSVISTPVTVRRK